MTLKEMINQHFNNTMMEKGIVAAIDSVIEIVVKQDEALKQLQDRSQDPRKMNGSAFMVCDETMKKVREMLK